MKSKLTLRLDEGLKERAKRLAEERRTSVSKIIEDYFRLLLRGSSNGPVGGSEGDISYEDVSYEDVSGEDIGEGGSTEKRPVEERAHSLSPRIRKLEEKLGKPAPNVDMEEDTRRWVETAAKKHAQGQSMRKGRRQQIAEAGSDAGAETILTRNEQDFAGGPLAPHRPETFLSMFQGDASRVGASAKLSYGSPIPFQGYLFSLWEHPLVGLQQEGLEEV